MPIILPHSDALVPIGPPPVGPPPAPFVLAGVPSSVPIILGTLTALAIRCLTKRAGFSIFPLQLKRYQITPPTCPNKKQIPFIIRPPIETCPNKKHIPFIKPNLYHFLKENGSVLDNEKLEYLYSEYIKHQKIKYVDKDKYNAFLDDLTEKAINEIFNYQHEQIDIDVKAYIDLSYKKWNGDIAESDFNDYVLYLDEKKNLFKNLYKPTSTYFKSKIEK